MLGLFNMLSCMRKFIVCKTYRKNNFFQQTVKVFGFNFHKV